MRISELEEKLTNKCGEILDKEEISQTEASVISATVQLITFTHGLGCRDLHDQTGFPQ